MKSLPIVEDFNKVKFGINSSHEIWLNHQTDDDFDVAESIEMDIIHEILTFAAKYNIQVLGIDLSTFKRRLDAKEDDDDFDELDDFDWSAWYLEDITSEKQPILNRLQPMPIQYLLEHFEDTFWPEDGKENVPRYNLDEVLAGLQNQNQGL